MQLVKRVITVGNSLGVTFPKEFVRQNRLKPGSEIMAQATDGEIKFSVHKPKASTYKAVTDKEFVKLIKDIESQYGEALEKLAKLP